jgi:polysaccharide export outer membrane protein
MSLTLKLRTSLWCSFLAGTIISATPAAARPQQAQPSPQDSKIALPTPQTAAQPSTAPPTMALDSRPSSETNPSLKLGVGDLIEMNVYNVSELATKTRVASDGNIYLPLISQVHVAGLTINEAQDLIEKRLSEGHFLKDPHVSLFVDEYLSEGVSILGEVLKPGVYPVLGQQRLFDLISMAGGLTEKAGLSLSVTRRDQPNAPITVAIAQNLSDNPESNVPLYPGDTVIVRKADIAYVVGDVARPSGILMDRGTLTVLQAVAMAGGTNRTASLGGTRILRKGPTGTFEVPIQLKKILKAKAPDVALQANDILIVPGSAGKVIGGRALEAALQAATLISVAAVY